MVQEDEEILKNIFSDFTLRSDLSKKKRTHRKGSTGDRLRWESSREQGEHIKRSGVGSWEAQLTEACSKKLWTRERAV